MTGSQGEYIKKNLESQGHLYDAYENNKWAF